MTATSSRIWVLGADDPEMSVIEQLLRACGETVVYATIGGHRVHPGDAHRADMPYFKGIYRVYVVECAWLGMGDGTQDDDPIRIDHHRPGDPGYGVPPAEFLRGSSLGQVIEELARLGVLTWPIGPLMSGNPAGTLAVAHHQGNMADPLISFVTTSEPDSDFPDSHLTRIIPSDLLLVAAADHCLAAAYAGLCPGVDVEVFGDWRIATRAVHQFRGRDEVLADVLLAQERIRRAPSVSLDGVSVAAKLREGYPPSCASALLVADLRGEEIPELPEAACRLGVAYLATPKPGPDGRRKVVLQCATAEQLAAWPAWAAENGIIDCYGGDPARGFAGGYLA
jgi:hypothetical protein